MDRCVSTVDCTSTPQNPHEVAMGPSYCTFIDRLKRLDPNIGLSIQNFSGYQVSLALLDDPQEVRRTKCFGGASAMDDLYNW